MHQFRLRAISVQHAGLLRNKNCQLLLRQQDTLSSAPLLAGTVIAAGASLYLSPDVVAFRARGSSPSGKQGLQVQGPYTTPLSSGYNIQLVDIKGSTLDSSSG